VSYKLNHSKYKFHPPNLSESINILSSNSSSQKEHNINDGFEGVKKKGKWDYFE